MPKRKRPAPINVGEIRARAVRARGARGPHDGRWYWRAEVRRRMVWRGWATPSELPRVLAQVLVEGTEERPLEIQDVRTIKDLMRVWLGTVVKPKARAEATYRAQRKAAKRISDGIGSYRLERIGLAALERWVGERLSRDDARTTISADLGTLRRAWRWGRLVGCCPSRDLPTPSIRPVPKNPRHTPTLADVAEVVSYIEDHEQPWAAIIVRLQVALGCRIGELAHLTWSQVDLERGLVTLRGKTGERVVPLRPDLVALFDEVERYGERVWPVMPSHAQKGVGTYISRACEALQLTPFTTHGLRRLAVDTLARSGVDVGTAAALLGHSPAVMLRAYRRVSEEDLRRAALELGRLPRGEVIHLEALGGHSPGSQVANNTDGN